jgi:anti-sigma regulatory factor (Ser/Thr protein kinase)
LDTIRLPAEPESLRKILFVVKLAAQSRGFSNRRILEIELAVEEAVTNVCMYAYNQDKDSKYIELASAWDEDEERLVIELVDSGKEFDPQNLGSPDLSSDLGERKIGGLGTFLIRKLCDDIQYVRTDRNNHLKLFFRRPVKLTEQRGIS